ncbi:MAG: hypothetical protein M3167_04125 [Acidobacteriota bacterium]|nr:hypothetical protein [Acidobacteriota bacterium]
MSSNPIPIPAPRVPAPAAPKPAPSQGIRSKELPARFVIKLVGHVPN